MPLSPEYDWSTANRPAPVTFGSGDRARLGWWVLLAVLLSVLVHIFLIILFDVIKVKAWGQGALPDQQLITFKSARVTISKSALDEVLPQPESERRETEEIQPLVDQSLDEFDLQEMLSELEVKLTPEVSEATRVVSAEEIAMKPVEVRAEAGEAAAPPPEEVKVNLASLKSQLLKATRASEAQPLLEINVDHHKPDSDEMIRGAAGGTADGDPNAEMVEGFSNLNNLLARRGPLSDNTKPILMPTDLLFEYDSSELRDAAKLSLMRLGILIQRNPDSEFIIEGHTDTFGNEDYNQKLSERRAEAVRVWLLDSLRIDADNVRSVGFGKSRPLANVDGSIEEQSINRRVEIVINKKKPRDPEA